ncbi:MAG: 1-acyl-sn-glycerol-3-phosphate acyltransferase [Clostridiales bacterium]|jgi:1-acylglycerol-3-phosphate O-acyltransferases|nr:1-acyl-sn-glycerol-3-phosphate acyltransferase [Clostridiales bacterium]
MEFLRILCKIFFSLFVRVRVIDADKMPREGGLVVAANHESMLDMFMIGYRVPRYIKWMAKEELFKNKLIAKFITACGAYPVKRSARDVSAARTTFEMLEKGEPVGIFPQGTRSKGNGRAHKAKHGVAKFAVEADVPVQPVAIWGKIRLFGRVYVRFGDPIRLPQSTEDTKYTKEEYQKMSQEILDTIYMLMEVPEIENHKS